MAIVIPLFPGTIGHGADVLPHALPQAPSSSIAGLAEALKAAVAAGDIDAARTAHEALGKLLARPADVVDLAPKRTQTGR